VRQIRWITGLASLFVVTGVLGGGGTSGDALTPEAAIADPVTESWRTQVFFDFSAGVTDVIWDQSGQIELIESAMEGGELIQLPRGDDWSVHFPMLCDVSPRECPRAILESGPAGILNPGDRPIRWGASVQVMPNERSEGSNVVQKGLSMSGTQYKLQVDGFDGRPSCVISGGQGIYVAHTTLGIADGTWHRLACERDGAVLSLFVDDVNVGNTLIPAGLSIVNDLPLRVGGKGHGPFNDQFHGTVDDVFVDIS
jgi:hypothetical protein